MTVLPPDADPPLHLGEGDWLRAQYQMAHHDIWWVKSQMMNAGAWTLGLLGALVAVSNLLGYKAATNGGPPAQQPAVGHWLAVPGAAVAILGAAYVWDLHRTLIRSRYVASRIIAPLTHPAFDGPKTFSRNAVFPISITAILAASLGLTQFYLGSLPVSVIVGEGAALLLLGLWGATYDPSRATRAETGIKTGA